MDREKIGALLRQLRLERGMTQKEAALALQISDKTISKWERGLGCPDISMLPSLSALFGVPIEKLLADHRGRFHYLLRTQSGTHDSQKG